MFFKNFLIFVFLKFLWVGLIFGLFKLVCNAVTVLFKKNVYVCNLVSFCFWLAFGITFSVMSFALYNFSFCWFGLLGMLFGLLLVKISVNFFFTIFVKLLYNKAKHKSTECDCNGKLQPNKEN